MLCSLAKHPFFWLCLKSNALNQLQMQLALIGFYSLKAVPFLKTVVAMLIPAKGLIGLGMQHFSYEAFEIAPCECLRAADCTNP